MKFGGANFLVIDGEVEYVICFRTDGSIQAFRNETGVETRSLRLANRCSSVAKGGVDRKPCKTHAIEVARILKEQHEGDPERGE